MIKSFEDPRDAKAWINDQIEAGYEVQDIDVDPILVISMTLRKGTTTWKTTPDPLTPKYNWGWPEERGWPIHPQSHPHYRPDIWLMGEPLEVFSPGETLDPGD